VKEQGRIELFDGDIRRDYVFVDDVARIMIEAWQARQASGVYNLGSGVVISHREIAAKVVVTAREAGVRLDREPIRTVPIPPALHGRFQFYTQAVGLLPWVADITAHPLEKMSHYWSEMLKPGDQPDAAPGEAR
jgi:ADP-L-glycero-D-manno-heptose 6-epimerase